ncbi:reverse transcriptase domain-containing protein, partial [Comamonas jiangduensis]|uniref:reverse transcriptase domain-containing protein n=1 Tax=Comamonas jiangduensis TaxID=1194168 RepID=UPI003BF81B7F
LLETYSTKIMGKQTVGRDRVTADRFEEIVRDEAEIISRKALSGAYAFTSYKQLLISKGVGKEPRVLSVPTQRDRLTLRCLCDFLFEVYPEQKTQIPQKKIKEIKEALASGTYSHFVKIDVKNFYPSINHDVLLNKLKNKINKAEILLLISSAIENKTLSDRQSQADESLSKNSVGVPQGLSISNVLAEIYLSDTDNKIFNINGIKYFRYVDDILILCNDNYKVIAQELIDELISIDLKAHALDDVGSKSKADKINKGFDFLGYQFYGDEVSPKNSSIENFEASLVKEFTTYKYALKKAKSQSEKDLCNYRFLWHLNLKITGCIFEGCRYGWMFYFSQTNDTSKIRRIDAVISKFVERFKIDRSFHIKKLLKSYYECKRVDKNQHTYIQNFDEMDMDSRRQVLTKLGVDVTSMSDKSVNNYFFKIVRKAIVELEKDLHSFS